MRSTRRARARPPPLRAAVRFRTDDQGNRMEAFQAQVAAVERQGQVPLHCSPPRVGRASFAEHVRRAGRTQGVVGGVPGLGLRRRWAVAIPSPCMTSNMPTRPGRASLQRGRRRDQALESAHRRRNRRPCCHRRVSVDSTGDLQRLLRDIRPQRRPACPVRCPPLARRCRARNTAADPATRDRRCARVRWGRRAWAARGKTIS